MTVIKYDAPTYSDAAYVKGVANRDERMASALYKHCKRYFDENYRGVFFVGNEYKDEIFQEAFIALWEMIASEKIFVENGELKGKGGKRFSAKLTTFFMSVAKRKYLEWVRKNNPFETKEEDELQCWISEIDIISDLLFDNEDDVMFEIILDCISHMSKRCNEILTMFYYEEKNLDEIMKEIPDFKSKNALKTRKYKCMEELRTTANSIYQRHLNA